MFDIIGPHSDRYYTHGTQFTALSCATSAPRFLATPLGWISPRGAKEKSQGTGESDWRVRAGLSAGQNIYTPENIDLADPDPNDRPYAGWAYVGGTALTYSKDKLITIEVQVGLVGPSALAGDAQNKVHEIIDANPALGWPHQLSDEVAFVVIGEHRWKPAPGKLGEAVEFDRAFDASVAVGTVRTALSGGATLRLGWGLKDDFGAPRVRPGPSTAAFFGGQGLSIYAFAGASAQLVARDIFLDGNTWQDSPRVDKRWFVPEAQAGLVARWGAVRVSYSQIWRGEEFKGQQGHTEFGSLSVTVVPLALLAR